MHIANLVKIYWYLPCKKNSDVLRTDNSVRNWWNLSISNSKPDLYNINAQTKFGENPLIFTPVIIRKQKYELYQKLTKFAH